MNTLTLYTLLAMSLAVIACAVVTYLAHRKHVSVIASSHTKVAEMTAESLQRERELTEQIERLRAELEQASMNGSASRIAAYLAENPAATKTKVSQALGMSRNTVTKYWPEQKVA